MSKIEILLWCAAIAVGISAVAWYTLVNFVTEQLAKQEHQHQLNYQQLMRHIRAVREHDSAAFMKELNLRCNRITAKMEKIDD